MILDNSSNRRVLKIKNGKKIKHFKVMIDLSSLIGTDFGIHYAVKDPKSGEIEPIKDVKTLTKAYLDEDPFGGNAAADEEEEEEVKEEEIIDKDNRDIVDNNQAQKLSHEEIEALKAQGMTGE